MDGVERLLWWLFGSSAGAPTRVRLVRAIKDEPRNNQRLADDLGLDYTTVRHHLRVLSQNGLVLTGGPRYGQLFFLSPSMESHWAAFERISAKVKPAPSSAEAPKPTAAGSPHHPDSQPPGGRPTGAGAGPMVADTDGTTGGRSNGNH